MKNTDKKHILYSNQTVRDALLMLNELKKNTILIVADENNKLIGSLTDGDLRRGFIAGLTFDDPLLSYLQPDPLFIYEDEVHNADINKLRLRNFMVIPVVKRNMTIVKILNLAEIHSVIPADVFIMAGGRGQRLMPLTEDMPKPMLRVGDKPILEHNIDRLIKFGIKNIYLSVNYLAEKIQNYFKDGTDKGVSIKYVQEDKPLGTLGSVKLVESMEHDYVMVMNSDLLTDIDYSGFFQTFIRSGADMAVATTSYTVDVPYGVMEVGNENMVNALKEKPRYTYYSNAGIYIIKKELLSLVPHNEFYNVTDLMESLIEQGKKLVSFPILGYWLDIGKHHDFEKAQEDIKTLAL
ncbi:MAG: NTP transferase domain-containing protein [Chitinophagales bacterium]|nr:nucleotidyltransferase family protein [Chitinophagaceae bacterium]MCB9065376.1 NTP transferase domain-containing protein [Chitinophagales bacterium]